MHAAIRRRLSRPNRQVCDVFHGGLMAKRQAVLLRCVRQLLAHLDRPPFSSRTSLTGHCGRGWACSLPRPIAFDPMYGPAVRCKSFRRASGERSCINVSGLWLERLLLATMDISARAISLCDRPRPGQLGHQCSHAPGRLNLHLVSSSRRPRQVSRIDLATSSRTPPFVPASNEDQTG